jgi:hypothetical protein
MMFTKCIENNARFCWCRASNHELPCRANDKCKMTMRDKVVCSSHLQSCCLLLSRRQVCGGSSWTPWKPPFMPTRSRIGKQRQRLRLTQCCRNASNVNVEWKDVSMVAIVYWKPEASTMRRAAPARPFPRAGQVPSPHQLLRVLAVPWPTHATLFYLQYVGATCEGLRV